MPEHNTRVVFVDGFAISGPFLAMWRALGDKAMVVFGPPTGVEHLRRAKDDNLIRTQQFTHATMELIQGAVMAYVRYKPNADDN